MTLHHFRHTSPAAPKVFTGFQDAVASKKPLLFSPMFSVCKSHLYCVNSGISATNQVFFSHRSRGRINEHLDRCLVAAAIIYIYIYAFSRHFYPKQLTVNSGYTFFISMSVIWELNPQPFCTANTILYQ